MRCAKASSPPEAIRLKLHPLKQAENVAAVGMDRFQAALRRRNFSQMPSGSGGRTSLGYAILLSIFALAACTPADTPDQLHFTPGAPIVVTQNTFATENFSLRYPDGWRIVTGPADAPQVFTFVSPDNCAIILVAVGVTQPINSPDCADVDFQTTRREITLGNRLLTVAGSAPDVQWETFLPQFELVASTLH